MIKFDSSVISLEETPMGYKIQKISSREAKILWRTTKPHSHTFVDVNDRNGMKICFKWFEKKSR